MPVISLPDGTTAQFPDEMPHDQIEAAVRSHVGANPEAATPQTGAQRVMQGLNDLLVTGPAQLLAHGVEKLTGAGDASGTVDRPLVEHERSYQARRAAAGAGAPNDPDWWRLGGNVAATLPMALAAPVGNSLLGATALGGVSGGLTSALAPVTSSNAPASIAGTVRREAGAEGESAPLDYWREKGDQMKSGAIAGAVTGPLAYGLSRVISPAASVNPEVQMLRDRGVALTPGQAAGGFAKDLEDKMTSWPVAGSLINNARRRAMDSFNQAVYGDVMAPLGNGVATVARRMEPGQDAVAAVRTTLGQAYQDLLPNIRFTADPTFVGEMHNLTTMAQNLAEPQANRFNMIIQNHVLDKLGQTGSIDGLTFKGIESELGNMVRGYRGDASFENRQLGSALESALNSMRQTLIRSNPDQAAELSAINRGYAMFTRLREAAGKQGADEGVFTPAQLLNSVRNQDRSAGKGAYATGDALMQELAQAGKSVLGNNYPDSGTAGRALLAQLLLGGAGAGIAIGGPASGLVDPRAAIPIGLAMGAYTRPGAAALRTAIAARPPGAEQAAALLRAAIPSLGVGAAGFAATQPSR